jgi:hypothetical protein
MNYSFAFSRHSEYQIDHRLPTYRSRRRTTRWSRPGQPEVTKYAILPLAGRAAHLDAVRRRLPPLTACI